MSDLQDKPTIVTGFQRAVELNAEAGVRTQPLFLEAYRVMQDAERRILLLDHAIGQLRCLVSQACYLIEADKRYNPDRILAWHLRFLEIGREELARDVR